MEFYVHAIFSIYLDYSNKLLTNSGFQIIYDYAFSLCRYRKLIINYKGNTKKWMLMRNTQAILLIYNKTTIQYLLRIEYKFAIWIPKSLSII